MQTPDKWRWSGRDSPLIPSSDMRVSDRTCDMRVSDMTCSARLRHDMFRASPTRHVPRVSDTTCDLPRGPRLQAMRGSALGWGIGAVTPEQRGQLCIMHNEPP